MKLVETIDVLCHGDADQSEVWQQACCDVGHVADCWSAESFTIL